MEPNVRRGRRFNKYPKVSQIQPPKAFLSRVQGSSKRRVLRTDSWIYSSLLNDPNTSSPANVEASNLYKDNRREYTKRVRETVEKSWDD